jgi:hypothetical protein
MRCVGRTTHVFDVEGCAEGLKRTLEFGAIAGADFSWVAENLEYLFFDGICYSLTALILNQRKYTELAKTANGTQHVHFAGTIA